MRYIYRVENNAGVGCYMGGLLGAHLSGFRHLEKHETPYEDSGILRHAKADEICGFLTLEQAMSWFYPDDFKYMARHGYRLKRVGVKEITAVGQKQILAIR